IGTHSTRSKLVTAIQGKVDSIRIWLVLDLAHVGKRRRQGRRRRSLEYEIVVCRKPIVTAISKHRKGHRLARRECAGGRRKCCSTNLGVAAMAQTEEQDQ